VILDVGVVVGVLLGSYLLGCLPIAGVVARRVGVDPTTAGSGNPGASNVYRTAGRRAGVVVAAGDVAKGAAAAWLGLATGDRVLGLAAGLAAVVGHIAPVVAGRRGGKGVATAAGATAVLFPLAAVAGAVVWLAVVGLTSIASLASLLATAAVLAGLLIGGSPATELALAGAMAAAVLARHTGNIRRLVRGDERRIGRDSPSPGRAGAPIPTPDRPPTPGADHR